jgi:hypothetical protein
VREHTQRGFDRRPIGLLLGCQLENGFDPRDVDTGLRCRCSIVSISDGVRAGAKSKAAKAKAAAKIVRNISEVPSAGLCCQDAESHNRQFARYEEIIAVEL